VEEAEIKFITSPQSVATLCCKTSVFSCTPLQQLFSSKVEQN